MAQQSKAQLLNDIHALLKKRYKPKSDRTDTRFTVLEAVVYGICHENTKREQANQALSRFKDGFFDWNEIRVSTVEEIQNTITDLADSEGRAHRIRRFLRQLFEKTYAFNLDPLTKKPLKESLKVLSEYEAIGSDYVEATVTQLALGGHAIPIDQQARRVMERLGIADAEAEPGALRSLLERAVPKNRGAEFVDLIEDLAHDVCHENEPECPRCELRKICPTATLRKEEAASLAKNAAAASRVSNKEKEKDSKKVESTTPKASAKPTAKAVAPPPPPAAPEAKAKEKPKGKETSQPTKPTKGRAPGSK